MHEEGRDSQNAYLPLCSKLTIAQKILVEIGQLIKEKSKISDYSQGLLKKTIAKIYISIFIK
jgi:hypothetical protein